MLQLHPGLVVRGESTPVHRHYAVLEAWEWPCKGRIALVGSCVRRTLGESGLTQLVDDFRVGVLLRLGMTRCYYMEGFDVWHISGHTLTEERVVAHVGASPFGRLSLERDC